MRGVARWSGLLLGIVIAPAVQADDVDLAIGKVEGIVEIARVGTYPDGASALAAPSTACNVGNVDIPYEAPMAEAHPVVVLQLYRADATRFAQIGISDARHEYFALSNSACSTCPTPSDGRYLGIGCSTTSPASINADPTLLGPRDEIDPFLGTWECEGSHFAGGETDCVRRHSGGDHDPLEHRLAARDSDLGWAGADYYYEQYFLCGNDVNHLNNLASRSCSMVWIGSHWAFTTPPASTMQLGPALTRWGGAQDWVSIPDDGDLLLASKAWETEDGRYAYEYALFNLDSNRRVRRFSIPIGPWSVQNLDFHDPDGDPSNDWSVTIADGVLTWETDPPEVDPSAPALAYGVLYNFRFETEAPPIEGAAELEAWVMTGDDVVNGTAQVPAVPLAVQEETAVLDLFAAPNPLREWTDLSFSLPRSASIAVAIYDARGRCVRQVMSGIAQSGSHRVRWDGRDGAGRRVAAATYFARIRGVASDLGHTRIVVR